MDRRRANGGHWTQVANAPPPIPSPRPPRKERRRLTGGWDGGGTGPGEARRNRRSGTIGLVVSVLLHLALLIGAGTLVPELRMRPYEDAAEVQLTLVEPLIPLAPVPPPTPLELRRLEEDRPEPPAEVPNLPLIKAQPLPTQTAPPRVTETRELPKLAAPTAPPRPAPIAEAPPAPPAPVTAPTPAPPTVLPKNASTVPSKLSDLDLHRVPSPIPQNQLPKTTLPDPGLPGGGRLAGEDGAGGGAQGGGAPGSQQGVAGTAANGRWAVQGGGGTIDCSPAAMKVMSGQQLDRCKLQNAMAAAKALGSLKGGDRLATALDGLGEKRVGFAEERAALARREASGAGLLTRLGQGSGPTPPSNPANGR